MASDKSYYANLPNCSIVDYELLPFIDAALLWCGVKHEDLAEEITLVTNVSQSIYKHPFIPCLEKKTRALTLAVNNNLIRAVREHGEGGEDGDHVAYARRHFWAKDLKAFISEHYPNDKPKTLFATDELTSETSLENNALQEKYQTQLAELIFLQTKNNELQTQLSEANIRLAQAETAKNDAEERLETARQCYREQKNKIAAQEDEITQLTAQLAEKKAAQKPQKINEDTLRHFIELIAGGEFKDEEGNLLTYSKIHSKLSTRYRNKKIPSQNTIARYLLEI